MARDKYQIRCPNGELRCPWEQLTGSLGLSMAGLLVSALPQMASTQLIAYEGFDYDTGDLGVVATGALGGGTGWETGVGWVDEGGVDASDSVIVDNPVDWGYADRQGNSLLMSGRVFQQAGWNVC